MMFRLVNQYRPHSPLSVNSRVPVVLSRRLSFRPHRPAALEHYKAAMLLSGVGDALGYRKQLWEYNESGPDIHRVSAQ